MRYLSIILMFLIIAQMTMAQSFFKGPALIEGVTSTVSSGGTLTLTKDSQTNQIITGASNHTIKLPDATTIPEGRRFYISNESTGILDVDDNNDSLLAEILTTNAIEIRLLDNSTSSGTWNVSNQYTNVDASIVISGVLPLINGGTNKAAVASNGAVVYSDADSFELSAVGSSGQVLRSSGAGAPSWSTATYPGTAGTSGTILRSNGTNFVNSTPTFPNTATLGKIMIGDGTNWIESTPTYPNSATGTGTILRADGTNWVATAATFPSTTTINQILYSSSNNVVGGITSANTAALITNSSGVPSFTSGAVANRLLRTNGTAITFSQADLTTDVTGILPMANGGTNKNMTAVNGGVVWTDADSQEVSAAGTSGQILQSAGAASPIWVGGVSAKTANYTLTASDDVVTGDTSGGTFTLTLPTAVGIAGKKFTIKKIGTGNTALAIATTSSQTIDGVTSFSIYNNTEFTVISDGSNWLYTKPWAWYVAANIAGANPDLGSSNQSTYIEITNSALTMTPVTGSQPVGIVCSSTNAAATPTTSTSTCSAGNEGVGVNFNIPSTGWFQVCAQFGHYIANGTGGVDATFQLVETATNSQTDLQLGNARIPSTNLTANTANNRSFNLCSPFYFSSVGNKAIRLKYEQSVSTTITSNIIVADASASFGQRDILITVQQIK